MAPLLERGSHPLVVRNLYDVPGLENFRGIAEQYGVRFVLIGSVCKRLFMNQLPQYRWKTTIDLFDLATSASDIDLVHSGPSELTSVLLLEIAKRIPSALSFRWQLRSFSDNAQYWESLKVSHVVPSDLISLTSDSRDGFLDRWDARADFEQGQFRYVQNGFYDTSPLSRRGHDLEFFTALSYVRNLLEAYQSARRVNKTFLPWNMIVEQRAFAVVRSVCSRSQTMQSIQILHDSSALRASLRYRYVKLCWTAPSPEQLNQLLEVSGINDLINYLAINSPPLIFPLFIWYDRSSPYYGDVLSSFLGGDVFRLGTAFSSWLNGDAAHAVFLDCLDAAQTSSNEVAVFASGDLAVNPGRDTLSEPISEFIHLRIPIDDASLTAKFEEEDYALALCLGTGEDRPGILGGTRLPALFSVPATFYYQLDDRDMPTSLVIRANCLRILAEAGRLMDERTPFAAPKLRLFVVVPK